MRRRNASEITPEKSLTTSAVASAMPSTTPITSIDAPITVAMYSGSSACTSSDDRSMQRLTSPSTHTPRGIAPRRAPAVTAPSYGSVSATRTVPARSWRATSSMRAPVGPRTTHSIFIRSSVTW